MRFRWIAFFLSLLFVPSSLWGAKILDGAWNGKPYSLEVLEKGVAAGRTAALSEWAFCSDNGINGVRYDEDLIQERVQKAAAENDPLALYLTASLLEGQKADPKKISAALKIAVESKHPMALWKLGVFHRLGIFGHEKDLKKGMGLIEGAAEKNCVRAYGSLAIVYRKGELGEVDLEKSAKYSLIGLSFNDSGAAEDICRARLKESKHRGLYTHYSEKEFQAAEDCLKAAADAGVPHETYYYGLLLVRTNRPHQGIPHLIRAAHKISYANDYLIALGKSPLRYRFKPMCYASEYVTEWKQAEIINEGGDSDPNTIRLLATSYLTNFIDGHPKEDKGVEMLLGLTKSSERGDCAASHSLARYFTHTGLFRSGVDETVLDRGMQHYLLHSRCPMAAHWLGSLYGDKNPKVRDVPKAIAALRFAIKINTGAWKKGEQKLQKELLKNATKEELAEAEDLIADDWPHAAKHREIAFKKLQKIGDLDPKAEFNPRFRFPQDAGDF